MARFLFDPSRLNHSVSQSGKEYNLRLIQRGQTIFNTLLSLLPSNYVSDVQGPQYTQVMKAVAVELARLELALEDVDRDRNFDSTRGEFLWSIIGYLVLVNNKLPNLDFSDQDFRSFFTNLIRIYFQGSVPSSMQDVMSLFFSGKVTITEAFVLLRQQASGVDISDEFVFTLDIPGSSLPANLFEADTAVRHLLDLVRPAHTLFRMRFVFTDQYIPSDVSGKILDELRWKLDIYYYDDIRSFWGGVRDRDRLGRKENQIVVDEPHGNDF